MLKKSLILLSIFCIIIFTSSLVFASDIVNGTEGAMRDFGNGIQTMVNGTRNTLNDAKNGAVNMMNNVGNATRNVVNGMEDAMSEDENEMNTTNAVTDDGYTAYRTATTDNMAGTNNTLVWIILAASAVAVIALVWFYLTQTNNVNNRNSRH